MNYIFKFQEFFFIIIVVSTFACRNYSGKVEGEISSNLDSFASIERKIIGKWGGYHENSPVWDISADSIFYYSDSKTYPYFFRGDTLCVKFMNRDTITVFGKVHFVGDTMKIVQYYRDNFVISAYRY